MPPPAFDAKVSSVALCIPLSNDFAWWKIKPKECVKSEYGLGSKNGVRIDGVERRQCCEGVLVEPGLPTSAVA